ncbi:MAG: hypothetical protein FJ388_26675 [Verrucomicrobia bacterium]|nr:hypothetical protein [Verrucomicrobiota bacterium]
MIPTPIRQVLSTFQTNGVQTLLMGGQACVFYGAAQVSKDVDVILLAGAENFDRLQRALQTLAARRIAVPRFDPALLERGHAVHFRCAAPGVEDLRVDIMTRLRDLPDFAVLWERRTVFADPSGLVFNLLSVPDLVAAKKTQRSKDWPVIELLVAIHYRENGSSPRREWTEFWLKEARSPEMLVELSGRFPAEAATLAARRPLLRHAIAGDLLALRPTLDAEARAEQDKDRAYWEPLKRELESLRRAETREPNAPETG